MAPAASHASLVVFVLSEHTPELFVVVAEALPPEANHDLIV